MITLAEYTATEILPLLGEGKERHTFTLSDGQSFKVKVSTSRLECFKRSQKCVWCKATGNIFRLQQHVDTEMAHLNMYWRRPHLHPNDLVLMTRDHIIPTSMGGADNIDNLATMCTHCNQAKGGRTPLYFVLKMTQWDKYARQEKVEPWIQAYLDEGIRYD